MSKRKNFHRVFKQYRSNLRVSDADNSILVESRRDTRKHLRRRFPDELRVKFLTQGSYAYGTLNRPNRVPPQQMDLDDGTYFPMGILDISSKKLFEGVDSILQSLVDERQGWSLDTSKPSCCRIIIRDDMHVDIPLYATLGAGINDQGYESLYREAKIPYLNPGKVLLAHRVRGWIESDPRKIINWVLDCKRMYGDQFLRISCYFKAWRDNQWPKSRLKSILIMAMVARAFAENEIATREIDDDDCIFETAGRMIDYLHNGGVMDPADNTKRLDADIDGNERARIVTKLERLYRDMESAMNGDLTEEQAYKLVADQFGKWFPKDKGLISIIGPVSGATGVASPVVSETTSPWAMK